MFKKIALVAAMAASASFATYSFFPVGDAHKGEVEIGDVYMWHDHWSMMKPFVNAKYNVVQNFELSLQGIGYQIWNENDNCDDNGGKCPDNDGITALTVGLRYQFMPILIGAVDVKLPLTSKDVTGDYDPLGFYGALQFTTEFVPNLWFGSELGLNYDLEDEDISHGLVLTLQAELDYTIASVGLTPWIGLAFNHKLTDDEAENELGKWKDHAGDNGFTFWIGAGYDINPMFTVKANIIFNSGDSMGWQGGKNEATGVNGKLAIKF